MKNKEVLQLANALAQVGNLTGVKFAYGVAKNNNKLKTENEAFAEATKASEEFAAYDKERLESCRELADKDEDGKPKMEKNNFVITEQKEEFDTRLKALTERNQEVVDAREKQLKEYNEVFLEAESSFVPFKIKMEDVPEGITASQLTSIYPIVDED